MEDWNTLLEVFGQDFSPRQVSSSILAVCIHPQIKPLREFHIRYLSMVLQCPELFGRPATELYVSGAKLAEFVIMRGIKPCLRYERLLGSFYGLHVLLNHST